MRPHPRYFFALQPPPAATDEIVRLTERLRGRRRLGPPTGRGRHHVSLAGLGGGAAPLDDWSRRAVEVVAAVRPPAFRVAFNRVAAFGRGETKALVLRGDEGVLGVDLLRGEIHGALAAAGLARSRERAFEAHLTLGRGPDASPEAFITPIAWTVREFVLIHSYVGESRYEIAARFRLA